ncbi:signal transduction histidine kinase, LytS [Spirosoma linguale DSM 74]|uniref:Signal transduction histidine kinase, LytS n=2 Tax=Spirosoma TaxID=107 RepID=D2QPN0_SPILD|nr:signal transduction histidine kinase, LytS [Spirosoma linguale DSM 74]
MAFQTTFLQSRRMGWKRVVLHLVMWGLAFAFIRYFLFKQIVKDAGWATSINYTVVFCQTVVLYYLIGHVFFYQYLYRKQYLRFISSLLLIYFLTSVTNYLLFERFFDYQVATKQTSAYVTRIWGILQPNGFPGAFTNIRVASWVFGYSFFMVVILLGAKAVKDVIGFQNRAVQLEKEKFELERGKILLENENLSLELNFLKSQINPHFLLNTLNSIYVRVVDVDEQAADQILRLSDLMRYGLYESNTEYILLERELEYIQNYLALESARKGDNVTIRFDQAGDFSQHYIAPLLLISLVENAFKHGVNKIRSDAFVYINAQLTDDLFLFWVTNAVPVNTPHVESQSKKQGGVGLQNTRKRLEMLYPKKHELHIETTPTEFCVTLTLQLAPRLKAA